MSITKKQIQTIVEEELNEILGLGKLFGKKDKPMSDVDRDAADLTYQLDPTGRKGDQVQSTSAGPPTQTNSANVAARDKIHYNLTQEEEVDHLEEGEEEKTYPATGKMKKLVRQAKLKSRYEPKDDEQLKKDYDKHVRNTRRDPKHADAHKRE